MNLDARQKNEYRQNLIDAGCEEDTATRCIELIQSDNINETLELLALLRGKLLDATHTSQKQIDCLDYFILRIKKDAVL